MVSLSPQPAPRKRSETLARDRPRAARRAAGRGRLGDERGIGETIPLSRKRGGTPHSKHPRRQAHNPMYAAQIDRRLFCLRQLVRRAAAARRGRPTIGPFFVEALLHAHSRRRNNLFPFPPCRRNNQWGQTRLICAEYTIHNISSFMDSHRLRRPGLRRFTANPGYAIPHCHHGRRFSSP
ncbi:hypothetical protein SAMN05660284_02369 [Formivibrio citricus]|uniref:Uncharacterized protein n=1 Tax=Formivibrio citricus TaxID=83765 RepID=A0A1I5CBL9_9NEIS|nr:hypothetical protein SAMN05660284_02369 [Formivibrio citricus]